VICMKNILIFICSLMVLGCDYYDDFSYSNMFAGKKLYDCTDFKEIDSIVYVDKFLSYKGFYYEEDVIGYCKNPEETYISRCGDCEDFAVLFLNIGKIKYNLEGSILLIDTNSKMIQEGGYANHTLILFNNFIYDPGNFCKIICSMDDFIYPIKYSYSFDEIFIQ